MKPAGIFLWWILLAAVVLLGASAATQSAYTLHKNITATTFWIGESADPDNHNIPNAQSAWDDLWQQHFGGSDDPNHRNGANPAGFVPKENAFYFALPYDDFKNGHRRKEAAKTVPWSGATQWTAADSMCKNRWIKITHGDKSCYAQWEDVGPFKSDDAAYVFGVAAPRNKSNQHAGLDVSPAVQDFLALDGMMQVDWQFVDAADVPDGPWKTTVTTSQICWK